MSNAPIHSFAPIEDQDSEVLILGSMPGRESLKQAQYYAHNRNAFWQILSELFHFDATSPYQVRVQALKSARIALWDVLQSCRREGSADARIESATQVANDFPTFFRTHRRITRVFFNGAKAEACYRRHVSGETGEGPIRYRRLPSTSPAYASMSLGRKLKEWRVIVGRERQRS